MKNKLENGESAVYITAIEPPSRENTVMNIDNEEYR